MQCFSELLPPTAVSHAVALPFLAADADNLIVAKTSLLQVFNVGSASDGSHARNKLVLVGEYPLAGSVLNLARVKLLETRSGGEAILVSLADAKLSLVEWDPENYRISTISIHYYEGENITSYPFGPDWSECQNVLTVDPSSRCAALKFGARQLAILPFRQSGDDLVGEEDEGFDIEPKKEQSQTKAVNGEAEQTPYKASFVLSLTALDPSLTHTVHLAFLHEYREPTFGILSSSASPSNSLLAERKDIVTYTVFTLDLEQRASTNLITVPNLPSSLWKVMPLPLPIGGALLVGNNELIHCDQSGKTNGVAVNEFAKLESGFGLADQSHLNMRLENCEIGTLDSSNGDLLIVLGDGSLATLNFEMLGRSIGGLKVTQISANEGIHDFQSRPSCVARCQQHNIFVGSEDGPSVLLGWEPLLATPARKRSHAQMLDHDEDDEAEEDEEDDDDLYQSAPLKKRRAGSGLDSASYGPLSYQFTHKDTLPSIGPINSICVGKPRRLGSEKLELLASSGRGVASRLAAMTRHIPPDLARETGLENVRSVWAIRAESEDVRGTQDDSFDNLLFLYDGSRTGVFNVIPSDSDDTRFEEHSSPEFEHDGETLEVNTLANNSRIVQCRHNEIRIYEANLGLSQIIPMVDDETDAEYNIVHTSFCDPYMLIVRDDKSVVVLHVQRGDIEPIEGEGSVFERKWLSGCIHAGALTQGKPLLFLLSADGALHSFGLPSLQPVYSAPTLSLLPPVLSADTTQRRTGTRENLTELLVAEIGHDGITQPYLVVRTAMDNLILYEPFLHPQPSDPEQALTAMRFRKVPCTYAPKFSDVVEDDQNDRLPALKSIRIGKYQAICIPGAPPSLIIKESAFLPQALEIQLPGLLSKVTHASSLHGSNDSTKFMLINANGEMLECELPQNTWYGTGWAVRSIKLNGVSQEVGQLAFHEERELYVVSTTHHVDFYFAPEDGRHQEQDEITMRPQIPQATIHLVSSITNDIIHSYEMPYYESITALKVMTLEVSENTHEQRPRIVVSTAALRGEDMPAKGTIMVFDIIDVVPEPDRAESGVKLHLVSREEVKGAITTMDAFPGGLIGTAQGQKVMIRGLKEDGSCLPVAFLDAQCHTTCIKSLGHSGLWLLADAWKGLWFGGFLEEPYKLSVLGKSRPHMEIMTADFLPFDGQLFILVCDANMDLHVLQYDPENPKTVAGMRLLDRAAFHIGHFPTTMTLLPSTLPTGEDTTQLDVDMTTGDARPSSTASSHNVLVTTQSGSVALVTPVDEATYRRLSALQTHLASVLEHAAALNPRAYRAVAGSEAGGSGGGGGGSGVVDGALIRRIVELGATRRADILSRAGGDAWTLRADLEMLAGGGLGYL